MRHIDKEKEHCGGDDPELQAADLTMRDWFAAQAILGLVPYAGASKVAVDAYEMADAMMAEREKRQ